MKKKIEEMDYQEMNEFLRRATGADAMFIIRGIINNGGFYDHHIESYRYDCMGPSWSHRKWLEKVTTTRYTLDTSFATIQDLENILRRKKRLGYKH